ncbi:hypothetical protein QR680_001822 [Steinernema hermaphroditum]|uniref:DUF19 domain-containing protein n=1 Tax=Steinernema hermaphroditum TaxID=289476 RepID=A0AA39LGZ1_9BILA|nr:hypothetical protein QR680_001822 [Steinernema hermaphroditum]
MLLSALLVLTLSALVSAEQKVCKAATEPKCNDMISACCDHNFEDYINISSTCGNSATMYAPQCKRQQIQQIYGEQGIAGVLKVCDAYSQYRTCLGKSVISCTTESYYIENSLLGVSDAQALQALYTELNFICGAGMDIYLNNDKCMSQVFVNNATFLETCRAQFRSNMQANPSQACSWVNNLLSCVQVPFVGCPIDSQWFMCELERVVVGNWLPGCSASCTVNQAPVYNGFKQTGAKNH